MVVYAPQKPMVSADRGSGDAAAERVT